MKRFITFAFNGCYPAGGWEDKAGEYDTLEEAQGNARVLRRDFDYVQVIDLETGEEHRA